MRLNLGCKGAGQALRRFFRPKNGEQTGPSALARCRDGVATCSNQTKTVCGRAAEDAVFKLASQRE